MRRRISRRAKHTRRRNLRPIARRRRVSRRSDALDQAFWRGPWPYDPALAEALAHIVHSPPTEEQLSVLIEHGWAVCGMRDDGEPILTNLPAVFSVPLVERPPQTDVGRRHRETAERLEAFARARTD